MRLVFPYAYPLSRQVGEQVKEQVRSLVLKIGNEMSFGEIMTSLDFKGHSNFLQNNLQPAIEFGFIEMTKPDSPNSQLKNIVSLKRARLLLTRDVIMSNQLDLESSGASL